MQIIKLALTNILLFSTLSVAENQFNLETEKLKLSNKVFNHYDLNKDKELSLDEFSTFSKEMKQKEQEKRADQTIKSCDKNNNGQIELNETFSITEMHKILKNTRKDSPKNLMNVCRMEKRRFNHIDKNKDNIVTSEELLRSYALPRHSLWGSSPMEKEISKKNELKEFKERLVNCDSDENGELTLMEATSMRCHMRSGQFLQYSKDPKTSFRIDSITHIPKRDKESGLQYMFNQCDKNRDKELTLVEATSTWCHMTSDDFIRLDTDKNQHLIVTEMRKKFEKPKAGDIAFKIMKNMPPEVQVGMALSLGDTDKNHKLSRAEAEKCELPMNTFEKFDSDKSDSIEQSDMDTIQKHREFEMVDMNSDKKIDAQEFATRMGNRCRVF